MPPDFYQRVLDRLINDELLYQAVEAKNLAPTQAEIDSEFSWVVSGAFS